MSGHGSWSGQGKREQRGQQSGEDVMSGATQDTHASWRNASDIANVLGVSEAEAQDYYDAVNGGMDGGFTWGWDGVIRAYQQGKTREEILSMSGVSGAINSKFGGDADAYMAELEKKALNCEKFIAKAPKWNGAELTRGYYDMSDDVIAALTTPNAAINLNLGSASWTTDPKVSEKFSHHGNGSGKRFIAHCTGKRRGTSVRNLSHFGTEAEVLCSEKEAFQFVRMEQIGGAVHAWYTVVDTNMDWGYSKKNLKK